MAEQDGTMAASTPAQSAGQAQPSAQSGGSTGNNELETLRGQVQSLTGERDRYKQQADGSRKYFEAGSKYGLKDEKSFDRLGPLLEAEKSGRIKLDQLAAALAEAEQPEQGQPTDMKAMLEKFAKEQGFVSKAELDRMERVREAKSQHQEMSKAEKAALQELMAKLLPENADDWDKEVYGGYLEHNLNQKRALYDDKHPLHFQSYDGPEIAAPFDRAALEKHLTEIAGKRDTIRGAKAAAKGDAHNASRGRTPTVAGAAAAITQRGPQADEDTDAAAEARRQRGIAKIEKMRNARAGAAV